LPNPSRRATACAAAVTDEYSAKWSSTNRTQRSLTFASIFFGTDRILPTQKDAAKNLRRFTDSGNCSVEQAAYFDKQSADALNPQLSDREKETLGLAILGGLQGAGTACRRTCGALALPPGVSGGARAAAEQARDQAGLRPDGTPNRRKSPVYVGGYDAAGNVMGTGNGPRGSGIHAEDIIQDRMPGAQMTEPYAWRRNKVTGELEWRPHTVCLRCQGNYPPSMFPPGTWGEAGGVWGD
jgi:hypothetical protein